MGTRRSRHNKGRKRRNLNQTIQANCAICLQPVFLQARRMNGHRSQVICASCSAGDVSVISLPSRAPLTSGDDSFLQTEEAKTWTIDNLLAMSEQDARAAFLRARFNNEHGHPECGECGSVRLQRIETRDKWRCKECGHEFSPTSGTILASRKLSFRHYVAAVALYLNGSRGVSMAELGRKLGIQYKSIYELASLLRSAASKNAEPARNDAPRYVDGLPLNNRLRWTAADQAALEAFCKAEEDIEKSATVLGRSTTNIAHKARGLGFPLPKEWSALLPRRLYQPKDRLVLLSYPYIARPRDEHSDILQINALVPQQMPEHMRADICQEIMLAVLEGNVSIAEIESNKKNLRWFIRKFWKENAELAGQARSLTQRDDDDPDYFRIAASVDAQEWGWGEKNDARRYADSLLKTYEPATQLGETYHGQLDELRLWHEQQTGEWLENDEIAEIYERG